jgi:hypothetical protein
MLSILYPAITIGIRNGSCSMNAINRNGIKRLLLAPLIERSGRGWYPPCDHHPSDTNQRSREQGHRSSRSLLRVPFFVPPSIKRELEPLNEQMHRLNVMSAYRKLRA